MILYYDFGDDDNLEEYEFEIDYRDIRDYLNTWAKADLVDCIMEEANFAEDYKEDIHDYFRDDAYEAFKDAQEYNKDPYAYYGVRRKDFLGSKDSTRAIRYQGSWLMRLRMQKQGG